MVKNFWKYLHSFWRNSRTCQTDGHRVPATAALMHSIAVMYNVSIWSSCVWSHRRGDAGQRCFVCNASRRARAGNSQSNVISWRWRTCVSLSVACVLFSRLAGGYSRCVWLKTVNLITFSEFEAAILSAETAESSSHRSSHRDPASATFPKIVLKSWQLAAPLSFLLLWLDLHLDDRSSWWISIAYNTSYSNKLMLLVLAVTHL